MSSAQRLTAPSSTVVDVDAGPPVSVVTVAGGSVASDVATTVVSEGERPVSDAHPPTTERATATAQIRRVDIVENYHGSVTCATEPWHHTAR